MQISAHTSWNNTVSSDENELRRLKDRRPSDSGGYVIFFQVQIPLLCTALCEVRVPL